jgi:hypothetical protein
MHNARPVFLELADRSELRAIAREWSGVVEIHSGKAEDQPADALLIRPDGHLAWAAAIGEPADTAADTLRAALRHWFGSPADA